MIRKLIVTVVILVPSLLITALVLRWIKPFLAITLGLELSNFVFVILFLASYLFVYRLVTSYFFKSLKKVSEQELSQQHLNRSIEVLNRSSSYLTLNRVHSYVNRMNAYQVILDSLPIGQITDSETETYELKPGKHEISVKIDWCETKPTCFIVDPGDIKRFSCGPNLDGVKFLLFPWYLTFGRRNYLWLRQL